MAGILCFGKACAGSCCGGCWPCDGQAFLSASRSMTLPPSVKLRGPVPFGSASRPLVMASLSGARDAEAAELTVRGSGDAAGRLALAKDFLLWQGQKTFRMMIYFTGACSPVFKQRLTAISLSLLLCRVPAGCRHGRHTDARPQDMSSFCRQSGCHRKAPAETRRSTATP